MEEVWLTVERTVVAVVSIASFTVLAATGHLDQNTLPIVGTLLGAVAVYLSGGHIGQVVQQKPSTPPPAAPPPDKAA